MKTIRATMVASAAMLSCMVMAEDANAQSRGRYVWTDGHGNELRGAPTHSVARLWNDALLDAIRVDFARPTVHARNLFHTSVAMWDAWAAYDEGVDQYLHHERATAADIEAARHETISYACYRLLRHRFQSSPGAAQSLVLFENLMTFGLGYDESYDRTDENNPASLGNRIAATIIAHGLTDGSREQFSYNNAYYQPMNPPLLPAFPGNPDIQDPNRWQPLALQFFIDQSGNPVPGGYPGFLSPEWGAVDSFALKPADATVNTRPEDEPFQYWCFHDPGPPPLLGGEGDDYYRYGFEMVSVWSSHLDPSDGVMIDISPGALGNTALVGVNEWATYYDFFEGGDPGLGHDTNPATGMAYTPQMVKRGDYTRILAEFWADGPDSETPPGHWFTILNYVSDHPMFVKQFGGEGPILGDLEWDVKVYLIMAGAMHDCAISAWGVKGWYDYIRPVSALRYMADKGQSSDMGLPNYHEDGITLRPGYIELVTLADIQPGARFEHLAGDATAEPPEAFDINVGKIALYAWRGPDYIPVPATDEAGVGWILAENWWPYQRPSFVTPPFAGYVSGHSTYSRAAAEVMTMMTGSEFFPGGMGIFVCPQDEFLVFEDGPSMTVELQWATYRDASDQTSLSRIWGGIHPPADDLPGRHMGVAIGNDAYAYALRFMNGQISCPCDWNGDQFMNDTDFFDFINDYFAQSGPVGEADFNFDGFNNAQDWFDFINCFFNAPAECQ